MEENLRKPIKRIPVFLSRITGEYPSLTFSVDGKEVPFRRGRVCLEGELTSATEVTVSVPEDALFIPASTVIPIRDGKLLVELVPRPGLPPEKEEELSAQDSPDEWEEVPDAEYFDDDDLAPKGKASRATIWILVLACLVCIAILVWFFAGPRSTATPATKDSDSVKVDTVRTDTVKKDSTPSIAEETQTTSPQSNFQYPSYSDFSPSEEPPVEETPKRREVPEGTDLAREHEH